MLPFFDALGGDQADAVFERGPVPPVLELLVPGAGTGPSKRADMYREAFLKRPGIRATRLLLVRLREDIGLFGSAELIGCVLFASPYAWTNLPAYLDLVSHAHAEAESSAQVPAIKVDRFDLTRLSEANGSLMRLVSDLSDPGLDAIDGRALLRHVLLDPREITNVDRQLTYPMNREMEELAELLDPRSRMGSVEWISSFMHRYGHDVSPAGALLGLRDMLGIHDPRDLDPLRDSSRELASMLCLVVWAEIVQRGLPAETPPPLTAHAAEAIEALAPDFVADVRRLTVDHGLPDLIPSRRPGNWFARRRSD